MVQIIENALTEQELTQIREFNLVEDSSVQQGRKYRNKTLKNDSIDQLSNPVAAFVVEKVKKIIPENHEVCDMVLHTTEQGMQIHSDGNINKKDHKAVLFPINVEGEGAGTIFFDNHYLGEGPMVFAKKNPWGGSNKNKDPKNSKKRNVTADYSVLTNYKETANINEVHKKHLGHIPAENSNGLTIEKIYKWKPGQAVIFDSTQLHCATNHTGYKTACTVFTRRID